MLVLVNIGGWTMKIRDFIYTVVLGILIGMASYDLYNGLKNLVNNLIEILIRVVGA